MTAALKYLNARVLLKLTFSSENEAKNPAIIAVQYLVQIEKKIEMTQMKVMSCFLSKNIIKVLLSLRVR